ncbi:hypothetical protein AYI68_g6827, partial [Smittium mucronatum]
MGIFKSTIENHINFPISIDISAAISLYVFQDLKCYPFYFPFPYPASFGGGA